MNNNNNEFPKMKSILSILLIFFVLGSTGNIIFSIPMTTTRIHEDNVLAFMTFNIHFGIDSYGKFNPTEIAKVIASKNVDIVSLQEVTRASPWNAYADLWEILRLEMLKRGYHYYYMDYQGAQSIHNAIFSKYPILETKTFFITPIVRYQRTLIMAKINVNGTIITVLNTHLTHINSESSFDKRVEQVRSLLDIVNAQISMPIVLMGDFNSKPEYKEIQLIIQNGFIDTWAQTNPTSSQGYTSTALEPKERIDYIFFKGLTPLNSFVVSTTVSDHLPVITITTI